MRQVTVLTSCGTCFGKGPSQRYALDERGDTIPIPFIPCAECGLQYPTRDSPFSPSSSLSAFADSGVTYSAYGEHVGWISGLALYQAAPVPAP